MCLLPRCGARLPILLCAARAASQQLWQQVEAARQVLVELLPEAARKAKC